MSVAHYYRKTEPSHSLLPSIKEELKRLGLTEDADKIRLVETESCFNIETTGDLSERQIGRLEWLLAETFERDALRLEKSVFDAEQPRNGDAVFVTFEFGPRMAFTSAFSSNAVSICRACDLPVSRLELSRRYRFVLATTGDGGGGGGRLSPAAVETIKSMLHDKMTEEQYEKPLTTFDSGAQPAPTRIIPIMEKGRAALEEINKEMGLGFDDFDLDYYTDLFRVRFSSLFLHANKRKKVAVTMSSLTSLSRGFARRRNSVAIPPMSSVLTWDSPIRNTRVTGSLVARWSLTGRKSPTPSFKWSKPRCPRTFPTTP
jgi:phosphoribosylformylglycinamidine synthase